MPLDSTNPYDPPQTAGELVLQPPEPSDATLIPAIQTQGQLSREELDQVLALSIGQRGKRIVIVNWVAGLILIGWIGTTISMIIEHPFWIPNYILLVLLGAFLYWAAILWPKARRQFLAEAEQKLTAAQYEFTTAGMTVSRGRIKHFVAWEDFERFRDSESLILLYCSPHDIVPISRNWFSNPAEFKRLVYFLGHKVEMAS